MVLKKGVNPSTDLEPEYIAVSGGKAYITLQENNAIAVLDLASRTFDGIYSAALRTTASPPSTSTRRTTPTPPRPTAASWASGCPMPSPPSRRRAKPIWSPPTRGTPGSGGDEDLGTFYLNEDERDFGDEGVTSPTGAITAENSGLTGKVVFFKAEDFDGWIPVRTTSSAAAPSPSMRPVRTA